MNHALEKGLIMVGALAIFSAAFAGSGSLKKGDAAPDFALPDQDEVIHHLSDYRGQRVLVYFYPKDNTPGCTKEACGLRDDYEEIQAANIVVLGISYDTPESHRRFIEKYELPFTLLSDPKKEVTKAYGATGWYPLPMRRSFLIDEEGSIIQIISDVDVTTHSQDVLNYFRETDPRP